MIEGMQATQKNELTTEQREDIIAFLTDHPVGVLATVDRKGNPCASTIYFTISKDFILTFTTKRDTNKYENISRHNNVMLVAYDAASQTSVQISGKAVEATNAEDQQSIYQGTLHAAAKTGEDVVPPIAKVVAGPYVGFFIEIDSVLLSTYGWGNNFVHSMKHARDDAPSGDPA